MLWVIKIVIYILKMLTFNKLMLKIKICFIFSHIGYFKEVSSIFLFIYY